MRSLPLTPRHLVLAARAALLPCLALQTAAVLAFDSSPRTMAATTFAVALVLLQAAPRLRAGDLLAGLSLFMTILESLRASLTGDIDAERWQVAVAMTGGLFVLLKVQHLRALARQDAYVPLRQLERRNAVFSRRAVVPVDDRLHQIP